MLLYVTLLSVTVLLQSNFLDSAGLPVQPRILGGKFVSLMKKYPHQISLTLKGNHYCGGSIYKSNIIITAAHCVKHEIELYSVAAGSVFWANPQQTAYLKKIIMHEKYNTKPYDYDIAVLVLDRHLTFNDKVQPIRLARQNLAPGSRVNVTGWGRIYENGPISDRLKEVQVELFSNSECQKLYPDRRITDRMLCAGDEAGGKGPCFTDSGGPLINADNGDQIGVVSWGKDCAQKRNPDVYASIPNFYDWIVETVDNNEGL